MRLATAFALVLALAAPAAADEWQRLGSRQVNFRADRDTVRVGAEAGRFTRLKLEIDEGNLEMYNLRIVFENGDVHSPETRLQFHEEARSRTLDLPGDARAIDRIEFFYRSKRERGLATVTVFGKSVGGDGPAAGGKRDGDRGAKEGEAGPGGWDLLGERSVDFGIERDRIPVTAREGRYRALRFEVESGNLDLYDIRVTFGDGDHYSPTTRLEFRQGSSSRTIDLPGGSRVIQVIDFRYRSELRRGRAAVRVFGLGGNAPPAEAVAETGAKAGADANGPATRPAAGRHPGWKLVGTREVSFAAERDGISLEGEGRFNALRVDVDGGDLEMFDVVVHFANGDTISPKTRLVFEEGARSRDLDLPGKSRAIDRIVFAYRSKLGGRDGRATIHVYGRR